MPRPKKITFTSDDNINNQLELLREIYKDSYLTTSSYIDSLKSLKGELNKIIDGEIEKKAPIISEIVKLGGLVNDSIRMKLEIERNLKTLKDDIKDRNKGHNKTS